MATRAQRGRKRTRSSGTCGKQIGSGWGETDTDKLKFPALSLRQGIEVFTQAAYGKRLIIEHALVPPGCPDEKLSGTNLQGRQRTCSSEIEPKPAGSWLPSSGLMPAAQVLVLTLTREGCLYEVALELHTSLDVFVVRKLGLPGREEGRAIQTLGDSVGAGISERPPPRRATYRLTDCASWHPGFCPTRARRSSSTAPAGPETLPRRPPVNWRPLTTRT